VLCARKIREREGFVSVRRARERLKDSSFRVIKELSNMYVRVRRKYLEKRTKRSTFPLVLTLMFSIKQRHKGGNVVMIQSARCDSDKQRRLCDIEGGIRSEGC
jgi:hypothetical protein